MAATVATARADRRRHAALVLTACLDGTMYFTVSTGSLAAVRLRGGEIRCLAQDAA